MKKLDTRITSKRKLTAKEYGEAVRNHYLPNKQQERLDIFFDIVSKQIEKEKQTVSNLRNSQTYIKQHL